MSHFCSCPPDRFSLTPASPNPRTYEKARLRRALIISSLPTKSIYVMLSYQMRELISSKFPKSQAASEYLGVPPSNPLCNSRLVFLSAGVSDSVWKSGFSGGTCFRKNRFCNTERKTIFVSSIFYFFSASLTTETILGIRLGHFR